MLMSLGPFVFGIDDALFDSLRRRRNWRHPGGDRVGMRPAYQFAGEGEDMITLGGLLAPGQLGRRDALDEIAALGKAGAALPLIDGEGYVYGAFVLEALDESKSHFHSQGLALRVDFTIDLKRIDDEDGQTGAAGEPVR